MKTYIANDLELNIIKANQNRTRYDKFIFEESNDGKHLIKYYCKLPKIDEIASITNEALTVLKDHLNTEVLRLNPKYYSLLLT